VLDHAEEAFGEGVVAVLDAGDFEVADQLGVQGDDGAVLIGDGVVEGGGEEAGFEAGGAEDGLLGDGDALDGVDFLGVDGLVDGDEVLFEMGDFFEVLEADDGEGAAGEAVFGGVLGGAGLALGGAGSGGAGGVGAVGGELFVGYGHRSSRFEG